MLCVIEVFPFAGRALEKDGSPQFPIKNLFVNKDVVSTIRAHLGIDTVAHIGSSPWLAGGNRVHLLHQILFHLGCLRYSFFFVDSCKNGDEARREQWCCYSVRFVQSNF